MPQIKVCWAEPGQNSGLHVTVFHAPRFPAAAGSKRICPCSENNTRRLEISAAVSCPSGPWGTGWGGSRKEIHTCPGRHGGGRRRGKERKAQRSRGQPSTLRAPSLQPLQSFICDSLPPKAVREPLRSSVHPLCPLHSPTQLDTGTRLV